MHSQDRLLSCPLHPAFPPGWKKDGAVWLRADIVHSTERMTRDENWTQAVDSGLSQSEAFLPLSLDRSDVAREHDVMLPIKGKCMHALEELHSDIWL